MNKRSVLIMCLVLVLSMTMLSCKKTQKDYNNENKLLGVWKPVEINGKHLTSFPYYIFSEDNKGESFIKLKNEKDKFNWEIKRKHLNIYYKKAPKGYTVASDRYNVRSMIKIKSITDTQIVAILKFFNGIQKEFKLVKTTMDDIIKASSDDMDPDEDDNIEIEDDSNPLN